MLAILGIVVLLVAITFGLLVGTVDRVLDDPEVKAENERRRKEEERQKAWREKVGKGDQP